MANIVRPYLRIYHPIACIMDGKRKLKLLMETEKGTAGIFWGTVSTHVKLALGCFKNFIDMYITIPGRAGRALKSSFHFRSERVLHQNPKIGL